MSGRRRCSRGLLLRPRWFIGCLVFSLACAPGLAQIASGQAPAPATESVRPPDDSQSIRRLFFPAGQAAKLVPDGFRPVDAERLSERLYQGDSGNRPELPTLADATYFATLADAVLVSGHSALRLSHVAESIRTVEFGRSNLAVLGDVPTGSELLQQTRLATLPGGELVAAVHDDAAIEFAWQRTADPGSSTEVRSFTLEIPPAPRSALFLQLPADRVLECSDAPVTMVADSGLSKGELDEARQRHLQTLADLQPDLELSGFRWWQVEAGGAAQLKLDVRRINPSRSSQPLRCTDWDVDYRADLADITWNARLQLIAARPTGMPDLVVPEQTRVISIRINGRAVQWVERKRQQGMTHLQISAADSLREGNSSIIIQGVTPIDFDAAVHLHSIAIDDPDVMALVPAVDVRLQVDRPALIADLELPTGWRIYQTERSDGGDTGAVILQLAGPVTKEPLTGRFLRGKEVAHGSAACQLVISGTTVSCTMMVDMTVEDLGSLPLRFDVQQGWSVTDVRFVELESEQSAANYQVSGGTLVLWPQDLERAKMQFVVRGERPLIRNDADEQIVVAPTWFLRPRNARLDTYYSVESLRDYGFILHENQRVATAAADLPEALQSLVGSQGAERRFYRIPRFGALSEILVHTRVGESRVRSVTTAHLHQDQVHQRFELAIETQRSDFSVLRVRLDTADDVPVRWHLKSQTPRPSSAGTGSSGTAAEASTSERADALGVSGSAAYIPATARRLSSEGQPVWEIEIPPQLGESLTVLGECVVPLDRAAVVSSPEDRGVHEALSVPLALPDVRDVEDQEGEVRLGSGLRVARQSLEDGIEQVQLLDAPEGVSHLRYQPGRHTTVVVAPYEKSQNRETYAWRHHITQYISANLPDRIESIIDVTGGGAFRVQFPPRLNFQDLIVNGETFSPESLDRAAGELLVPAGPASRQVQIRWQHNRAANRMLHVWSPAEIRLDLPSLETAADYQLVDRSAMLWPMRLRVSPGRTDMRPPQRMVLMQPSLALCLVIAVALIAGLLGWKLSSRYGLAVRIASIVLLSVGLLFSGVPAMAALLASITTATACFVRQLHAHLTAAEVRDPSAAARTSTVTAAGLYCLMIGVTFAGGLAPVGGAPPRPIPVLIPVDRDGEVAGSKVYLAENDYARLFRQAPAAEGTARYLIHRATHRIDLGKLDPDATAPSVPSQSDYMIENLQDVEYLDLQLDPEMVRRIRVADSEDLRFVRWEWMEDRVRLKDLPKGVWQISVNMVVPIQQGADSQLSRLQLPVLPSHRGSAVVDHPASLDVPVINQQFPSREAGSTSRTIVRMLGAVSTLELSWRKSLARPQAVTWRGVQWNRVGPRQMTEEVQLQFPDAPPAPGQAITLRVARAQHPIVTTPDWRLDPGQAISDNVSEFQLIATRPTNQRPTLTWITDLDASAAEIQLTPVTLFNTAGTQLPIEYLGLSHAEFWSVEEMLGWREAEPSEFYSAWSGVRRDVSVALTPLSPDTSLELIRSTSDATAVVDRHRLVMMPGGDLLRYEATVYPSATGIPSVSLRIPSNVNVSRVEVNGRESFEAVQQNAQRQLLVIRDLFGSEPVNVLVEGYLERPQQGRLRPPRIAISGQLQESAYEILRHPGIDVTGIDEGSQLFETQPFAMPSDELLRDLAVPVVRWQLEELPADATSLPIRLQKKQNTAPFDCTIVTRVNWDGSRWSSETRVAMQGEQIPRILRLEVPTEWTGDLTTDADAMLLGPETADSRRALRLAIRPGDSPTSSTVTLTARRSNTNSDQIAAPLIDIPAARSVRRVYLLPAKLTTRTLQWHTPGLRRLSTEDVPDAALQTISPGDAEIFIGLRSAPAPVLVKEFGSVVIEQFAAICDVRLYETGQSTRWALVAWDIQPSNNHSVRIRLDPSCHVESVWTANKPAVWNQQDEVVDVQLNLSQLAQRVGMLMRIEGRPERWIPTLLNLPTRVTTVAILQTDPSRLAPAVDLDEGQWARIGEPAWRRTRADAILTLLESSADGAASRSVEEVAGWLQPWEQRFRSAVQQAATGADGAEPDSLAGRLDVLQDQMDAFIGRLAGDAAADSGAASEGQPSAWAPRAIYVQQGDPSPLAIQPANDPRPLVTVVLAVLGFCAAVYWFGLKRIAAENRVVADGLLTGCAAVLALPVLPWPVLLVPVLAAVATLTRHGYWSRLGAVGARV